jgi:hypothetical protein
MADIEAPSALRTRFGTWTPAHAQAWSDLIRTLQRGRYITNASTVDLAGIERAFLTAFNHSGINVEADGDIAAALDGTATARAAMFDRIFRMYAQNRGSIGAMMNVSDSDTTTGSVRIDSPPSTIPSTFRAQPPSSFTAPTGQTREVAWAEQRQKEWTQLTARLRAAGYLPGDGTPSEQDVYRAFLKSQQSPTDRDANEIGRAPELTDPDLLSAFNAAYAARQTPRYREDGSEITLASPPTAAPDAPPSGPGALAPRYRAMSTALGGIGSQQDLDRLNALLNPHRGTPPVLPRGRVRATGAAATAAQELAVATLGGRAQMAEHIQTLLGKSDAELGDLKPYVDALRAQLRGIPPGNVLTKIDDWLKDNMAGVTTDLAIMIARSVPTGEGESSPSILQGWAQAIGAPTTGRTTRYTAPQLLGSGENGVVTLSVQAVQIARAHAQQQPGTPAPPPGGPPGAGG